MVEVSPEILPDAKEWVTQAVRRRRRLKLTLSVFATSGAASAYYVAGAVEQSIGKSAPWFVLGMILLSCAVRALRIESNDLFGKDDAYNVVREGLGTATARLASIALLFDCLLVGPICARVAGAYVASQINELGELCHLVMRVPPGLVSTILGVAAVVYYWRKQITGRAQSNKNVPRLMTISAILVAAILSWCLYTMAVKGFQPVPLPFNSNIHFSYDSLGWSRGTVVPSLWFFAYSLGLVTLYLPLRETIARRKLVTSLHQ